MADDGGVRVCALALSGDLDAAWDLLWHHVYNRRVRSLEEQERLLAATVRGLERGLETSACDDERRRALHGFVLRTYAEYSNVFRRGATHGTAHAAPSSVLDV